MKHQFLGEPWRPPTTLQSAAFYHSKTGWWWLGSSGPAPPSLPPMLGSRGLVGWSFASLFSLWRSSFDIWKASVTFFNQAVLIRLLFGCLRWLARWQTLHVVFMGNCSLCLSGRGTRFWPPIQKLYDSCLQVVWQLIIIDTFREPTMLPTEKI